MGSQAVAPQVVSLVEQAAAQQFPDPVPATPQMLDAQAASLAQGDPGESLPVVPPVVVAPVPVPVPPLVVPALLPLVLPAVDVC